jgi:superfamily II DNA/RNA helicase
VTAALATPSPGDDFPLTAVPAESSAVPEYDATPSFATLGVPAPLVEVLDDQGITAPFPVQAATLPDALAGRDILGRARTGSGKTLGFSLPLVSRLAGGSTRSARPRGLVLVPTRELATQVTMVLKPLARAMDLWVATIYGGVAYGPQVSALQRGTDIVVATPGRLADLIGQGECDLSDVEITVIDEADQMADLGFLPIVRRLLDTTPAEGQRMLFSATLDAAVDVLARRFLHDPVAHSVDENASPAEIEHHVITIDAANRVAVVAALVGGEKRSLVFTRTKHGAERLSRQLTEAGIPAAELHGNLRQGARSRNLAAFASGLARVMIATDIAARGIHIDGIDLVIHADPPAEHKAYVHRSGRTARGGADGVVVTLQTKAQARDVTAMMRKAGITPHAAVAVDQDSEVVAEIAGPPAPLVTVRGKVSELVRPEDRLVKNDQPGIGKPWEGRPRRDRNQDRSRDRKPRDDRFRARGPRDLTSRDRGGLGGSDGPGAPTVQRPERFERDERPARERPGQAGQERRPALGDRRERFGKPVQNDRFERGDRTPDDRRADNHRSGDFRPDGRGFGGRNYGDRQDRPSGRDNRSDRGGNDWWPRSADRGAQGGYRRPGSSWQPSGADSQARGGNRAARDHQNRDGWKGDDRGRSGGNDRASDGDRASAGNRTFGGNRQFRDGRPGRDFRPSRDERPFRDEHPARDGRAFGGNAPFAGDQPFRDDRSARYDRSARDERPARTDRSQADRYPQAGGPSGPRSGRSSRPQTGGHFGGSSRTSGYSAGRGAAGNRRDPGQGRHF